MKKAKMKTYVIAETNTYDEDGIRNGIITLVKRYGGEDWGFIVDNNGDAKTYKDYIKAVKAYNKAIYGACVEDPE